MDHRHVYAQNRGRDFSERNLQANKTFRQRWTGQPKEQLNSKFTHTASVAWRSIRSREKKKKKKALHVNLDLCAALPTQGIKHYLHSWVGITITVTRGQWNKKKKKLLSLSRLWFYQISCLCCLVFFFSSDIPYWNQKNWNNRHGCSKHKQYGGQSAWGRIFLCLLPSLAYFFLSSFFHPFLPFISYIFTVILFFF